jgi:hypothetical protein
MSAAPQQTLDSRKSKDREGEFETRSLGQTASRLLDVRTALRGAGIELGRTGGVAPAFRLARWAGMDEMSEVSAYTDAHIHACAALYLQLGLGFLFSCWC